MNESNMVTAAGCNAALRASLGNKGYAVKDLGLLLEARKQGEECEYILKILPVSSLIQEWDYLDQVRVSASFAGVKRLLEDGGISSFETLLDTENVNILNRINRGKASTDHEQQEKRKEVILCIGFGVCQGSYERIETSLVDLRAFFCTSSAGAVFSIDRKGHFFHYTRTKDQLNLENGVIFRTMFCVNSQDITNGLQPGKKPEGFVSSIKSTTAICSGLLLLSLAQHGYEVHQNGSFVEASNANHTLAILQVNRCLAGKNVMESTPVAASYAGIWKLLDRYGVRNPREAIVARDTDALEVVVGNAGTPGILCVAFGVCKYSYSDAEIVVVPVKTIMDQASFGNVFSIGMITKDMFYDYSKANSENMKGIVLQTRYIETEDRGN